MGLYGLEIYFPGLIHTNFSSHAFRKHPIPHVFVISINVTKPLYLEYI